jgi:hypothetical protein
MVFSGSSLSLHGDLEVLVREARGFGVKRVVLHAESGELEQLAGRGWADEIVVSASRPQAVTDLLVIGAVEGLVTLVLPLSREVFADFPQLLEQVRCLSVNRLVLTWPLGGETPPPSSTELVDSLESGRDLLDDLTISWGIKNLPPCQFGQGGFGDEKLWRSSNRWYVDTDHQRDKALLFFPEVVRFHKGDSCRYCKWDLQCDGVLERWYRQGLTKALQPL